MPPPAVLVANPRAAGGRVGRDWREIQAVAREHLGACETRLTGRPGHATELARAALREGAEWVVAVGGDGTLSEVVDGFFDGERVVRAGARLGFLPAGTGGDFRRTVGLPADLRAAAARNATAAPRPIDAGRLRYRDGAGREALRHFVNIASFGLSGLVDRYVNASSKALGGTVAFVGATLRALGSFPGARVRLRLDGGPSDERLIGNVAVANGRYFGSGMKVAPDADPADGLFDVVIIDHLPAARFLLRGHRVYAGTHVRMPEVRVARARRVEAEPAGDAEVLLDVDGEQPGRLPATFEIVPGALRATF